MAVVLGSGLTVAGCQPYVPDIGSVSQGMTQHLIHEQWGPLGFGLSVECDPGGGSFPCSTTPGVDANLYEDTTHGYTVVEANPQHAVTFVNAIGNNTQNGSLYGQPIRLTTYQYVTALRLSGPSTTASVPHAGEQTHVMIMFWDGGNRLGSWNMYTREAAVFWKLNPWDHDYGKFMAYYDNGGSLAMYDTGCHIDPTDTNWHVVDVRADLVHGVWAGVGIDGCWNPLAGLPLARIHHPNWGQNLALIFTAESENLYPGQGQATWFETQFRDFKLFSWD